MASLRLLCDPLNPEHPPTSPPTPPHTRTSISAPGPQVQVPDELQAELQEEMCAAGIPVPESQQDWDDALHALKVRPCCCFPSLLGAPHCCEADQATPNCEADQATPNFPSWEA